MPSPRLDWPILRPKRAPELPDVLTIAELGRPVPASGLWFGVMAPAGTPPALVARMAHDLEAFAGAAEARAKLATQRAVPDFVVPEPFAARRPPPSPHSGMRPSSAGAWPGASVKTMARPPPSAFSQALVP